VKALVVAAPGDIALLDVDAPAQTAGDLIVRPLLVGLCGTDLEIIDGSIDQAYVRMPLTIGHEWAGIVVASAPGAPVVGTRVVVEGIIACGACSECINGDTNRCLTYDELGFTRPGAAAELIAVPAALAHPLDDAVSYESGVLVEPASVVYRAIDRAGPIAGTRVLIVGDGTVGLLAATLIRNWSPSAVHVLGARAAQRPLAMAAGADAFFTDATALEGPYGLVIEAAGVVAAAETAIAAVARGGSVVLIGLAGTGAFARLPIDDIVNGDISIVGSFSYTTSAWQSVVNLLNMGLVSFDFLVTHRFAFDEWESAVSTLRHSDGVRGKVLLRIGDPQDG
jgi:2-desacetyl-2-hydroxyethyl bacteriochlorophyllide A dehydrogenase